jgi:hypothetical protein
MPTIRIPTYPTKQAQAMLLRNSYMQLGKMARELGRFTEGEAEIEVLSWSGDHGINFCVSAWHMLDGSPRNRALSRDWPRRCANTSATPSVRRLIFGAWFMPDALRCGSAD